MKYLFSTLPLLLIVTLALGQSGIPLKLFVYPNISQPTYQSNDPHLDFIVDTYKELEKPKTSYSIGFQAGLSLNNYWYLYSGVNYMKTGYKTKKRRQRPAVPGPSIPEFFQIKYIITNIEIPIHAQRIISKKEKIKYYAIAGPSLWFNISHKQNEISTYEDGRVEKEKRDDKKTEYKAVNLAASLGFGLEWVLNEKFSFYVQPLTQMGFLGMAIDVPLNRDIFNFGLSAGFILK